MLKKSASVVLASFRPSTYPRGYASGLHLLRPCWTVFLSILQGELLLSQSCRPVIFRHALNVFPQPARSLSDTDRSPAANDLQPSVSFSGGLAIFSKLGGEILINRLAMADGHQTNHVGLAVDGVDDSKAADAILP